jgi:death-on-curing protein
VADGFARAFHSRGSTGSVSIIYALISKPPSPGRPSRFANQFHSIDLGRVMAARIYPTIAETIELHRLLIEEFGGSHRIRDRGPLESAVMRPQNGYYNERFEEVAALMESLGNNHAFSDGNKRICFVMTDAMLRASGYFLDLHALDGYRFIVGAMERKEFRFALIRDWLCSVAKPVTD